MMTAARLSAPTCFSMTEMAFLAASAPLSPSRIRVRQRCAIDLGRERAEAALVGHRLRGERHREVRPAVVAVVERDDGLLAGVLAGDLDGVLDRFGAGVEQRALLRVVARRDAVEGLGDGDVGLVRRDHEAGVRELRDLRLHRLDDLRVRVAERRHGDARAEVDERVAVGVDDDAAAGGDGLDRYGVPDTRGDGGGLAREQLLRARTRDAGDQAPLLRQRGSAERRRGDGVGRAHEGERRRSDAAATPALLYILGTSLYERYTVEPREVAHGVRHRDTDAARAARSPRPAAATRRRRRHRSGRARPPGALGAQLGSRRPDAVPLRRDSCC